MGSEEQNVPKTSLKYKAENYFSVLFHALSDGRNKTISSIRNRICFAVLRQFYFTCAGTIRKKRKWTCIAPIVSITRPLSAQIWITPANTPHLHFLRIRIR